MERASTRVDHEDLTSGDFPRLTSASGSNLAGIQARKTFKSDLIL